MKKHKGKRLMQEQKRCALDSIRNGQVEVEMVNSDYMLSSTKPSLEMLEAIC
jgi:hypothetical protein